MQQTAADALSVKLNRKLFFVALIFPLISASLILPPLTNVLAIRDAANPKKIMEAGGDAWDVATTQL